MSSKSYTLDANFFITIATIHYPMSIFPALYEQLKEKLPACSTVLQVMLQEIKYKEADDPESTEVREESAITSVNKKSYNYSESIRSLKTWIESVGVSGVKIKDNSTDREIYNSLISNYEPDVSDKKSISANDLRMIAYAKENNITVVTYEKYQSPNTKNDIKQKNRYKIPLVCHEEGVRCITAVEYFAELGIRI